MLTQEKINFIGSEIINRINKGMTNKEAIEDVLGAGIVEEIANKFWDIVNGKTEYQKM